MRLWRYCRYSYSAYMPRGVTAIRLGPVPSTAVTHSGLPRKAHRSGPTETAGGRLPAVWPSVLAARVIKVLAVLLQAHWQRLAARRIRICRGFAPPCGAASVRAARRAVAAPCGPCNSSNPNRAPAAVSLKFAPHRVIEQRLESLMPKPSKACLWASSRR